MASRSTNLLSRANRISQVLQSNLEAIALRLKICHISMLGMLLKGDHEETHFNVKIVSAKFDGQGLVRRHRMVYDLLADELKNGLHAISIVAKTPQESGLA
ncbi:hypothetical protein HPP92_008324 [Vanilla planifolia]|uniref:Bola-like protein n=1 Tax=Vanilla planifolia TaxID=51239 RepID=A0A835R860_VANPL|nr:hypothetical protein HPP92_008324 [Vanilla planifolia]